MSAQNRYSFNPVIGAAGGIVDLAPYAIDTFLNEEEAGVMKFGCGVVAGSIPGTNVALPGEDSTAAKFEGIVTNNRTTEYDVEGKVHVRAGASMGVMRYGRIYARVAADIEVAYGDKLYCINKGDEVGCFTNVAGDNTIEVKGRFIGAVDTAVGVAPVELFNQAQA